MVVSNDSHVGPKLRQQLRDYCPARHLPEFDAFADQHDAAMATAAGAIAPSGDGDAIGDFHGGHPNLAVPGHYDPHARLRDLDGDGVAAEVLFHFSQNDEPLPFVPGGFGGLGAVPQADLDLAAVGYRIYNRWLADFVSVAPQRYVGLAYLPTWDIDAAVREAEWAAEAGLRGVNFPPPSRAGHLEYNHPAWEPFWTACERLAMPLVTHSSGAAPFDYLSGPGGLDIMIYECGGWLARRAVWWLVHGRVFDRHPDLKLVITEQYEGWWSSTLHELDSIYLSFGAKARGASVLPRLPSEYVRANVWMGASFPSVELLEDAHREGYVTNVLWGSDYPHVEGTYLNWDGPSVTRTALSHALSHLPAEEALMVAGTNAVGVYGLDVTALAAVAARIGAPTVAELTTPPVSLPEVPAQSNAFRGQAGLRPIIGA